MQLELVHSTHWTEVPWPSVTTFLKRLYGFLASWWGKMPSGSLRGEGVYLESQFLITVHHGWKLKAVGIWSIKSRPQSRSRAGWRSQPHVCLHSSFYFHSYTVQGSFHEVLTPTLDRSKLYPPTGHPNLDNPSLRPSSQIILDCAKWKII